MSWVPPYAIDECREVLQSRFGEYSPSNALTRLGLQYWIPTPDGGVVRTTEFGTVSDGDIAWFRDWGAANDIEVLLCVYNCVGGAWDWALAVSAFGGHRSAFAANLVAAMESHGLDGIDIDLEGIVEPTAGDRLAFKSFLQELSAELKLRGKVLTVDSFHSPLYNAPNMSWWADWKGLADSVHSMGYDDLYEGSTVTLAGVDGYPFRYSWQQNYAVRAAGLPPDAVSMGLPSWLATWGSGGRGDNVLQHIRECIYDCAAPASVCIWDMQLAAMSSATNWRSPAVWQALRGLAEYESVPADRDGDGMADRWEARHMGSTNAAGGGPLEDRDSDGYPNRDEYAAGTDPTNQLSGLTLRIRRDAEGKIVVWHPACAVGPFDPCYGDRVRCYWLEQRSDLSAADWQPVPGFTNVAAVSGTLHYTNAPSGERRFYRVGVSLR